MSNVVKNRTRMRWVHIATGLVVGTYIYSPWSGLPWFDTAVKAVILPALALTGIWMWQQGRIRRWLKPTG